MNKIHYTDIYLHDSWIKDRIIYNGIGFGILKKHARFFREFLNE